MTTLINIRFIQIKRALSDTGFRIFFIIGFLLFLVYASYVAYQKIPDAYILTAVIVLCSLLFQFYRTDKVFVYNHISNPHAQIFSEYFVFTFPFSALSLLTANWFYFPVLVACLWVVPFIRFTVKERTYFKNISSVLPASNFEWISGFRKSFIFLIPLYVLAMAFSWFRILPLALFWLITLTISSFYLECEPLHILKENNPDAGKFLRQKLYQSSKYLLLFAAPVITVNTIFNTDDWLLNLLIISTQLVLLCFAICFKYSGYEPNVELRSNNIILSLVSFCSLIPYLLPVPLMMAMVYYSKAKQNLANYLND